MSRHWWTWVVYVAAFSLIVAGHAAWFVTSGEAEVGSRFGAALTCLGIIVTARPYFRAGLHETVDRQLPPGLLDAIRSSPQDPVSDYMSLQRLRRKQAEHKLVRPGIVHDVVAERVVGVVIILLGTLVHGYGDLPLRWIVSG